MRIKPWVLPAAMLTGALLGLLIGASLGERWADPSVEPFVLFVRMLGVVFLSALKALIVPLVVTSIVVGVTGMGDLRRVGKAASATVVYFMTTTFLAVVTGIVLVSLINPGSHAVGNAAAAPVELAKAVAQTPARAIYDVITSMFPSNIIAAAADSNILGLIVFSVTIGIVLSLMGPAAKPLNDVIVAANDALLKLVRFLVWFAPLGILGLVADRIGKAGGGAVVWQELAGLGWYAATVMLGLLVHAFINLSALLVFIGRRRWWPYARGMVDALLTAFGTASSAATMAVTLQCVVENNKVARRAADLVIPLGTTVNMDGTALYEAVAVIFIAQSMGIELSFAQHLLIAVTATLAAVGAAAIPEAGLVTMVLVLGAVGLPAEGIGLLLSIDWILDRFRTTVNVWGDSIGAAIVDRMVPADDAAVPTNRR